MRRHRNGRGLDPPLDEHTRSDIPVEQRSPRDRGSSTVEFVIASAAMVLLLLMVVQVGVWYHTRAVAQTDALAGLAETARTFRYIRPKLTAGGAIRMNAAGISRSGHRPCSAMRTAISTSTTP